MGRVRYYALTLVSVCLLLLAASSQAQNCGKRKQVNLLITNGLESKEGDWPWHVALFHNNRRSFEYACGGSILDQNTILTAAHCLWLSNGLIAKERLLVQVGRSRLRVASIHARDHEAYELIVHPKYNVNQIANDIALIKLATDITFTNFVQPICLWNRGDDQSSIVGTLGTVIGFGYDENDNPTDTLREARLPVVSAIDCIQSNREAFATQLTSDMFCAGYRNGTSPCNGDSGGGLFFNFNNVWYIRGLVSFTKPRQDTTICDTKEYTVFTDVAKYLRWIEQYLRASSGLPILIDLQTNHNKLALLPTSTCGPNAYAGRDESSKPVLLGYPWVALLEYTETGSREKKTICQATLISDLYLISAAHCVSSIPKRYTLTSARLGEYDVFNSMGLFARLSGGNRIGASPTTTERFGSAASRPISRLVAYRTNFLESWLWQNVSIGRTGSRTVHEVLPDTTTSWYLTGFSIDPVYGLGIIKKPIQFTTVQPFYIVDSLPYSIKRGEAAVLQFTLFNNLGAEYIADVTLYNVANQTEFIERPDKDLSYTKSVSVPPKVGVPISFGVKARKLGEMVVRIKASIMTGKETDAMEKVIRVMPENIMFEKTETRFFSMEEYGKQELTISLDIPKNISTVQIECRISSNLLSPVIHNLDSLLDVPSASGAPSMINFIPPLVVLDYLKAVSSTTTHLIEKATGLLRNGYQLELKYRQRDGSFGNWRDSKGSVFVTALVGTSLEAASKHITEVDLTLVDRLFEWLAAKQHSSGRFDEEQPITYHSLQGGSRNGIALTSFVLIAFLQNTKASIQHRSIIEKGIQYVANQLESIADVYDLSLATYALMLADHRQKSSALNKLIELGIATNDTRYWPRHTASIETTAYALLSLVHAKRYADGLMVMHWLVNQQSATGSFPRTQDTFVGIRALAALSEAIAPQKNDYTAIVLHGKARKVYKVAASEADQEYRDELPGDSKLVRFSANGRGFGMFTVAFQYGIDVRNIEHGFSLRLVDQFSNEAYTLQLQVCTSFSPQLMHTRSNLALVEVNFPSGYVVSRKSLVDETRRNPFKDVEVRYGQTSLVIYYETLGPEENCFSVTANRLFRVAFHRQAYVMVHDTYDEKFRAIKFYQVPHDGADIQSYLD